MHVCASLAYADKLPRLPHGGLDNLPHGSRGTLHLVRWRSSHNTADRRGRDCVTVLQKRDVVLCHPHQVVLLVPGPGRPSPGIRKEGRQTTLQKPRGCG